jgi:thioredoxin reductase (NADPH)
MYDVIIIGGGAAGLTAGIYSSRAKLKTLLIDKKNTGGLASVTDLIENYPGFPDGTNGMELAENMKKQAQKFGTEIKEFEDVKEVKKENNIIKVTTEKEEFETHTLIIAAGSVPKLLNIPGEKEFTGKGVSYCATCDGPLFAEKDVAIIGTGNSGLQEGEAVSKHVNKIKYIEFLEQSPAEKILVERAIKDPKAEFIFNHMTTEIKGDKTVNAIIIKDRKTDEEKEIKVQGIFIYIGWLPNTGFIKGLIKLDKRNYIITDENMETNIKGIYAIGDIRSNQVRQIPTAIGNAVTAVVNAQEYIRKIKQ